MTDSPVAPAMRAADAPRLSYRYALPLDPLVILERCTRMGRVIVGMRAGGALLERIRPLQEVHAEDGRIIAADDAARTAIDTTAVAAIVIDRSETPHDTVLNYVDFLDAEAQSILKVTALDDPEAFERALEGLARAPLPYLPPLPRSQIAVDRDDPAMKLLGAAAASGLAVTLSVARPGGEQAWRGVVVPPKPGHAYINLIQDGMHLHLAAGAVAGWSRERNGDDIVFRALTADGTPGGLVVTGVEAAFAALAPAA